jgi:hypothetical protein
MKNFGFLLFFLISLTVSNQSQAQYTTGIGLRAGVSSGLTVRHFVGQEAAIEGILATRWGGLITTGLFEIHKDIRDVKGLLWFFGGGAHFGTWNAKNSNRSWGDNNVSTVAYGLTGIVGLDYAFADAPINLSLDWKPSINFGEGGFWWDDVAISVRFIF